jgi:hypothetical protein
MPDEQYTWLDRDAVERLLRGEPLETFDADTRAAAHRVTGALEALTALNCEVPSEGAELPGEEAALAAFRAARAVRDSEGTVLRSRARTHCADAGPVGLGRPGPEGRRARWGRPVRLGVAAALVAGTLGGVAVAAGAVILPTPLRDDRPDPGSSVSAVVTPNRPLDSPSPEGTAGGSLRGPSSGGASDGPDGGGARDDTARGGAGQPDPRDLGKRGAGGTWRSGLLAACRELRAGKGLDAERRRGLEEAAGGKGMVKEHCRGVLAGQGGRTATGTSGDAPGTPGSGGAGSGRGEAGQSDGNGGSNGDGGSNGKGQRNGNGQSNGEGRSNGDGKGGGGGAEGPGIRPGGHHRLGNGVLVTPIAPCRLSAASEPEWPVPPSPAGSAPGFPVAG